MNNHLLPEELQIHDLVYYDPNVFIEDEYVPTKDIEIVRICNGDDITTATEGCYYPIPFKEVFLTKENGFEKINGFTGKFYRLNDYLTVKEYDDDTYTISFRKGSWEVYLKFKYVHELQHILRIIGYSDIADNIFYH